MGDYNSTKQAYYGDRIPKVTCVTPEFPYCPVCPYALIEDRQPEDTDSDPCKVYCLLSNCYVWKVGVMM